MFVYDSALDELVCEAVHGETIASLRRRHIKVGQGLSGWVAANRRTVVNSPGALDSEIGGSQVLQQYLSSMSVPVLKGRNLLGVVTVYAMRQEAFSPRHGEILEGVASHLAPLLRRRYAVGRVLPGADGFLTARHLDEYVRHVLDRRSGSPLFLLVLRVSTMARTTSHGIRQIVGDIYSNLRGGDLVFVCDSQTVVCLLADGDEKAAKAACERIVRAMRSSPAEEFEGAVLSLPEEGATLASLLNTAEQVFDSSAATRAAS